MDTIVLKFGGSSVSDNIKLNTVAQKIIEIKQKTKNVVVVVSAQGKTTDKLIKEAGELSAIPDEREMDMLLSTGELITASKLSILLKRKGFPAISLTGWQAGIQTNSVHKNAKIEAIYPKRIMDELEKGKIVVVAGFQGIDENQDVTTLGRGGSDTTAVALQAALGSEKCYIFSDVDGIYSTDPKAVKIAKKLDEISFEEMQEAADAGAKVLHNRCIQIGKKFDCAIYAKSTFCDNEGTKIFKKIENSEVKNIVKNNNLVLIEINNSIRPNEKLIFDIYKLLLKNNIIAENFKAQEKIQFRVQKNELNKVLELIENNFNNFEIIQKEITKLTVVGYSIIQDNIVLNEIIDILEKYNLKIYDINLMQSKIEILLDNVDDNIIEELHYKLFS